jgi:capsular polysaccharide biosynthesis protein
MKRLDLTYANDLNDRVAVTLDSETRVITIGTVKEGDKVDAVHLSFEQIARIYSEMQRVKGVS